MAKLTNRVVVPTRPNSANNNKKHDNGFRDTENSNLISVSRCFFVPVFALLHLPVFHPFEEELEVFGKMVSADLLPSCGENGPVTETVNNRLPGRICWR